MVYRIYITTDPDFNPKKPRIISIQEYCEGESSVDTTDPRVKDYNEFTINFDYLNIWSPVNMNKKKVKDVIKVIEDVINDLAPRYGIGAPDSENNEWYWGSHDRTRYYNGKIQYLEKLRRFYPPFPFNDIVCISVLLYNMNELKKELEKNPDCYFILDEYTDYSSFDEETDEETKTPVSSITEVSELEQLRLPALHSCEKFVYFKTDIWNRECYTNNYIVYYK